jgi:hypothetical protein
MLPVELWKHIALQYAVCGHLSPAVYTQLALVSHQFVIPTPTLQEYYLRKYITDDRIEYKLPNNKLHSPDYGKLPAVIYANGDQAWYVDGKQHRDNDMPAVLYANGSQAWYVDGKRHRNNDLPAVIHADSGQYWYIHGKSHRDNGLPAVISAYGDQYWYVDDKRHRDNDMPAVIYANGNQEWYTHGKFIK